MESVVAGYLLFHLGYDTERGQSLVHVIDLYVKEAFQHRGIASALMERVAEIGRSRGAKVNIWSVYNPNETARGFCQELGAEQITSLHFMSLAI